MNLKSILGLFKEAIDEWGKDKVSRLAAALAYYTIFSIAPLLIILIAIIGAVFGEAEAQRAIVQELTEWIGSDGAGVIQTAIQNASLPRQGTIASVISIVLLVFGATGVFAELQDSLNTIWEVQPKPGRAVKNIVRNRFLSFAMVLGIGFLLLVSLIISTILTALISYFKNILPGFDFIWQIANFVLSFGVTTVLFGLIFKLLPDVKITWNDVWIGATLTSLLFSIGRFLLGLYLGSGSFGSVYGAAGSVIVVLGWVYYAAQILFFGAEFTQVYSRKYGSQIVPDKNAIPLTEQDRLEQGMKPNQTEEQERKASGNPISRIFGSGKRKRVKKNRRNQ